MQVIFNRNYARDTEEGSPPLENEANGDEVSPDERPSSWHTFVALCKQALGNEVEPQTRDSSEQHQNATKNIPEK